ncbi:MAG: efflux RND transporter permease subunit, partial [Planctomycetota bacterium]|nr:efflux RND transporter permease subunit [Planctomycetota bacterium]
MGLADIAVRRRIAMLMLTLVVALFGAIALTNLGLDFFPELEYPLVSIVTTYGTAASEEVEEY